MNEALQVLDDSSIDRIVGARLQAAIDTLGHPDLDEAAEVQMSDAQVSEILNNLVSAEFEQLPEMVDALGVPAYLTDPKGQVTYWNSECVAYAGRRPELGNDRWCVLWKLYTADGYAISHDRCPMAIAIQEQRSVRGEIVVAERPNGQRAAFRPYPTPLFDKQGKLIGAVNILLDVSRGQFGALKNQAALCRRIARSIGDKRSSDIVNDLATSYEEAATSLTQRR